MNRFIQKAKEYYVLLEEDKQMYYVIKEGKEISFKGYEDCDFFFYKERGVWWIAEGFTGSMISSHPSFSEAKKIAEKRLLDKEEFIKMIVNTINKQDVSPRFHRINTPNVAA